MSVHVEWQDRVVLVTIDRPERRNAVDLHTLHRLAEAQRQAVEGAARVLVLTGAAPAFCAGADLSGVEDGEFTAVLLEVLTGFGTLPFPTLAAVDGPALGAGTQLAVACDLRVSSADSRFGIPAAKLGLAVDRWTVQRLAGEVGSSIARNMLLTATTYRASELVACGFVHRLGHLADALVWADEIARLAPLSITAHKMAIERAVVTPPTDELVDAARDRAWRSADAEEGRRAFLEKRTPHFTGE